jgi:hypothetical protein
MIFLARLPEYGETQEEKRYLLLARLALST